MLDEPNDVNALAPEPTDSQNALVSKLANKMVQENCEALHRTSQDHWRSSARIMWMYTTLFLVGLLATLAALIKGLVAHNGAEAVPALILAGLAAASFLTLVLLRPLESLARHTFFSSWFSVAMNTYWMRLLSCNDPNQLDAYLKETSKDLLTELGHLLDRYLTAISRSSVPPDAGAVMDEDLTKRLAGSPSPPTGGGTMLLPADGVSMPMTDGAKPPGRAPRSPR
jgi:hypothetical protein